MEWKNRLAKSHLYSIRTKGSWAEWVHVAVRVVSRSRQQQSSLQTPHKHLRDYRTHVSAGLEKLVHIHRMTSHSSSGAFTRAAGSGSPKTEAADTATGTSLTSLPRIGRLKLHRHQSSSQTSLQIWGKVFWFLMLFFFIFDTFSAYFRNPTSHTSLSQLFKLLAGTTQLRYIFI